MDSSDLATFFVQAVSRYQTGDLIGADHICGQIIQSVPHAAGALHLRGLIARRSGEFERAVDLIDRAIVADPTVAEYHVNLAATFALQRRYDQAVASYRRAIELNPALPEAHYNLGVALQDQREFANAATAYRRALELRPDHVAAAANLGSALVSLDQLDEGVAYLRRALSAAPNLAAAHVNLGVAYIKLGRPADATAPLRRALSIDPDNASAHWNLATALLALGDMNEGWREYEWRLGVSELGLAPPQFTQPQWNGSPLDGWRILLHAEQGFGDTIQFARYAPLVAERGGQVIVACQPELKRLLTSVPGITECVALSQPLPPFVLHCPLPGLPLRFGTELHTIPSEIPYLSADPASVARWSTRLPKEPALRVGLVWKGNPFPNPRRSMPRSALAPLLAVEGVWFCSLQKDQKPAEGDGAPLPIADWTAELRDFADTAALIASLDLVVTIDTAVAHLAGALGKPVWVLLPFVAEWRWLSDRTDSPWYPTLKLFRQDAPGDWSGPVARILRELSLIRDGRA